jgi:hypothetical protein
MQGLFLICRIDKSSLSIGGNLCRMELILINRCYVPDPFVALIDKHTGYLAYSLQ